MQIRPHITLLFILSVFTFLLMVSFAFYLVLPEGKDSISLLGGLEITFMKPNEILKKQENYADISEIIAQNQIFIDSSNASDNQIPEEVITEEKIDTLRANADSLKKSVRRLEFPNNDRSLLYPVFKELESALSRKKIVRIMHYGDSQIEGDRITSFIRSKLQAKFGGSGVGLIPARQLYDFKYSVLHDASDNWYRYTLYGNRDTLIKHNRYGILAGFNSFTPQPRDTNNSDSTIKTAVISIKKSPYSYKNTKSFQQCRLLYGYNPESFSAKLYVNNEIADSGIYPPSRTLKQIQWVFSEPTENIMLEFKGKISPEVYGIALDAKSGIAVDNVAMRGSSGLVFTKMDPKLFGKIIDELNVKLLILQFGGNIVPTIRKSYSFYERWFYSQLKYIRKHAPEVQIIVIGVADMSMKKGSRYVSYPNIELVRDALKKASFKADAIYWDMYEAMGGENSMPSWVFANPPLAGKDFVHFNPRGAKIIANMFYNAFLNEYKLYKKKQAN